MRGVRVDFCPCSLPKVEQTALKLRIKTVKNDHSEYCQCCAENECGKNDFQEGFSVCLFDAGRCKLRVVPAENFDNLRDSRNEHCGKTASDTAETARLSISKFARFLTQYTANSTEKAITMNMRTKSTARF